MKIGFVGVGTIATAVIEGIFKAKIKIGQIIVSPKNYKNAKLLQKKFKKIKIAKSNQEVLDKSDWIFLAVTPKIGKKILISLFLLPTAKVIYSFLELEITFDNPLSKKG